VDVNSLDVVVLLLVLAYAVSGYWQGFITGAFATAGLVLGGLAGFGLAPYVFGHAAPSVWVTLGALVLVLLSASVGQALLQFVGARIRSRITWQPARALDAVGGAVLSAVAVLVIVWALGLAVSGARLPWVTEQVRGSRVLAEVDGLVPQRAVDALGRFNDVVASSSFPAYLDPFTREQIIKVGPPPPRIAQDPDVRAAGESVLKVHGDNGCGQGVEGSGFLYQPDRLMTNAHVVAGVDAPRVVLADREVPASVVLYDPALDIAVLAVPGLQLDSLAFDKSARAGQPGAVLGYPEDGPYDVQGARIRERQRLRSPNIYGEGTVLRDVFSVRSDIRPGNSGGPLVSAAGRVTGGGGGAGGGPAPPRAPPPPPPPPPPPRPPPPPPRGGSPTGHR
jgi:S1-C subfamily serine protease